MTEFFVKKISANIFVNGFCNAYKGKIELNLEKISDLNTRNRRVSTVRGGSEREKGTFIIKILDRSNSTWQGTINWVEKQQTQNFRSALELLKLIDGALDQKRD